MKTSTFTKTIITNLKKGGFPISASQKAAVVIKKNYTTSLVKAL